MYKITPEDLVQYLYHETSTKKAAEIQAALEIDWSLRDMFEAIQEAHQTLVPASFAPRDVCVDKILRYASRSMNELHHH